MNEHEARQGERQIGAEEEPGGYDNPLTGSTQFLPTAKARGFSGGSV